MCFVCALFSLNNPYTMTLCALAYLSLAVIYLIINSTFFSPHLINGFISWNVAHQIVHVFCSVFFVTKVNYDKLGYKILLGYITLQHTVYKESCRQPIFVTSQNNGKLSLASN